MSWTPEQLDIINHENGHAKVSAVAGSGKSATLVERVARLLSAGGSSQRLQVVMFNASACSSFTHKLRQRLRSSGSQSGMPEVRTFHALGMKLCKTFSQQGHLPNWRLETRDWVESKMAAQALEQVIQEKPSNDDVELFMDFIGLVKTDIISADDKHPEASEITGKPIPESFIEAYEQFESLRAESGIRFFSDLLYDPVMLLLAREDLSDWLGNRLDHLLVDEYQDINEIQQALVTIIAGSSASVMVVGDVDQCIYEWRGAKPEYIETLFDADFPDATNFQLSYTFRYGHAISLAANQVISNNRRRDGKLCLSHGTTPATQVVMHADSSEMSPVVNEIRSWVDSGRSLTEVAVLVRLYGMSVPVELALLKDRIPYQLDGRDGVFKRREARMLFGYLRVAAGLEHAYSADGTDPKDYFEAMLTTPGTGLPRQQISQVAALLTRSQCRPGDGLAQLLPQLGVVGWRAKRLKKRADLMAKVAEIGSKGPASEVMHLVNDTLNLDSVMRTESIRKETGQDRAEVCQALMQFVAPLSVTDAMSEIETLMAEATSSSFEAKRSSVTITSMHKAKGLEWPLVILPGLREGGIPAEEASQEPQRVEAERRLCYVGMTRAQERLCLIHPADSELEHCAQAHAGAKSLGVKPIASRFLYEANIRLCQEVAGRLYGDSVSTELGGVEIDIAEQYLERIGGAVELTQVAMPERAGGKVCGPETPCRVRTGMRVKHLQFGQGEVLDVFDRAGKTSIRVKFDSGSEKIVISHMAEMYEV